MHLRFKMAWLPGGCALIVAASLLCGCRSGVLRPGTSHPAPPVTEQPAQAPGALVPGHAGRPYSIIADESLLSILAFRGGALSKAGHNHVIAAHDLSGTVYVPENMLQTSFELRFAVAQLKVDEPELRAREGADFPPDMPESAREGTRHNMLGPALLDAERFPEITLLSEQLERAPGNSDSGDGSDGAAHAQARVRITVRGQSHSVSVPVRFQLQRDQLIADGELPLRQSELGLTPFSAMLGALQVQDEMRVKFHVVAKRAPVRGRDAN